MKALIYSLITAVMFVVGLFTKYPDHDSRVTIVFFVFFFWPCILMIMAALTVPGFRGGDTIKMQNYHNLDAIRRNSDREARNSSSWQNKK